MELSGAYPLVEGKAIAEIGHLEGYSGIRTMDWGIPARSMETAPYRKKVTWIVRASEGTALKLKCSGSKIGKIEGEIIL